MRWKIILPNLLVVLIVGLASWLYLRHYYENHFDEQSRLASQRDRGLFEASNQLGAVKFLRTVVARSRAREVEGIFAPATVAELASVRGGAVEGLDLSRATDDELQAILRLRAHGECQAFRVNLQQEQAGGRTPEIVAITDGQGVVISRDVNPNAPPVGVNLRSQYGSIARALEGTAVRDFWYWNQFLLDVAIAPIRGQGGETVGTLLVGYDISNGVAQADEAMFGAQVAYMYQQDNRWNVHSASLVGGAEHEDLVRQVAERQSEIAQSIANTEQPHFINIEVRGTPYIGLAGLLPGDRPSVPAGYLMLHSIEGVRAPAGRTILAFLFALGGIVLVVAAGLLLSWHFLTPIEQIEDGILRVINGDLQHRFEVKSSDFGGLAYRVNQLVAALTGEEEETEGEPLAADSSAPPHGEG